MISVHLIIFILFVHWVADFIIQTEEQATTKSKSNIALTDHVATYTAVLALSIAPVLALKHPLGFPYLAFVLLNGAIHWCVDWRTSRWTSKLFGDKDFHNGFVVVGADQLIHTSTLILTANWLLT